MFQDVQGGSDRGVEHIHCGCLVLSYHDIPHVCFDPPHLLRQCSELLFNVGCSRQVLVQDLVEDIVPPQPKGPECIATFALGNNKARELVPGFDIDNACFFVGAARSDQLFYQTNRWTLISRRCPEESAEQIMVVSQSRKIMLVNRVFFEILPVVVWQSTGNKILHLILTAELSQTLDHQPQHFDKDVEAAVRRFDGQRRVVMKFLDETGRPVNFFVPEVGKAL